MGGKPAAPAAKPVAKDPVETPEPDAPGEPTRVPEEPTRVPGEPTRVADDPDGPTRTDDAVVCRMRDEEVGRMCRHVLAPIAADDAAGFIALLSESAVLAAAGTIVGLLGASWSIDWMTASWPEEIPYWVQFDLDGRIVAFTVVTSVVTTLAIGLLPALRASRPQVHQDLKEGGRSVSLGRAGQRTQTSLAIAQVALCLALLVGANLMIRSFLSLQRASIGFDDAPVLTFRAYLAGDAFDENQARANFFDRAVEALRATPGVSSVAATTSTALIAGAPRP